MSVTAQASEPKARHRAVAAAVTAVLLAGAAPARAGLGDPRHEAVTITFSYRLYTPYAAGLTENQASQTSQNSCALQVPRRANGIDVLRAAVDHDCIRSFSTVRNDGRELLHCINDLCGDVTKSPGVIPDTAWFVAWNADTQSYWRSGLGGYAASDGERFDCKLVVVN